MQTFLKSFVLSLITVVSLKTYGQELKNAETVVFNGNLWGRSSIDFRSQAKNIQFSIPVGSEAKIIETKQLKGTGSYALRVKITRVGKTNDSNPATTGAETWVYFSQKEPWLSIKSAEGFFLHDPEVAFKNQSRQEPNFMLSPGVVEKPSLPTQADILREQKKYLEDPNLSRSKDRTNTEAGICLHCSSGNSSPLASNQKDIQQLHGELIATPQQTGTPDYQQFWEKFPEVMDYSKGSEVLKTISYGIRNRHSQTQRLCYRYVKRALQASGLVKEYPPGAIATLATRDLKVEGFRDLMKEEKFKNFPFTPESSPKGAVLVYCKSDNKGSCDNSHPGHIEIKTDWGEYGGYVSDFYRRPDQPLFRRKLIAVMVK